MRGGYSIDIEWVENRKWKTDHYYKLVHRYKRDFASVVSDRTQAKYWQRVVWLLLWSMCSYFSNRLIILVPFVCNISTQPFYQDDEPTKEQLMQSAFNTRRVQIPGAFMIFWAIGFLILLKLEYSNAVLAYSMVAFAAPILWLILRRISHIKF